MAEMRYAAENEVPPAEELEHEEDEIRKDVDEMSVGEDEADEDEFEDGDDDDDDDSDDVDDLEEGLDE